MATVKILIATAEMEARVELKKAFMAQADMEIVAETGNGEEVANLVKEKQPDIVLLDSVMGGQVTNGIEIAEKLSVTFGSVDVVMVSAEGGENIFLRQAMFAGVKQVLPKPYDTADLIEIIRLVAERTHKKKEALAIERGEEKITNPKIISVFSTKGGVGRTLLATNLAVAMKKLTNKKVCLVDLDLQFGDVSIMLNLKPQNTLAGLAREIADAGVLEDETLTNFILKHEDSGLDVLAAPNRPDEAETIKQAHISEILRKLTERYHYTILDLPTYVSDISLISLEASTQVLLLLNMELPTVKSGKLMCELMGTLDAAQKIKVVLNREDPNAPYQVKDISEVLGQPVSFTLPSDGANVIPAVNDGVAPYLRDTAAPFSVSIAAMVKELVGEDYVVPAEGEAAAAPKKSGGFSLFGKKK